MSKISRLLVISLCFITYDICSNSFTKPKTTLKTPSSSALKEDCANQAAEILKHIPDLMNAMADLQKKTLYFLEDLIDGQSIGFCTTASKPQLAQKQQKMVDFNKKMNEWEAEMRSFAKEINQTN